MNTATRRNFFHDDPLLSREFRHMLASAFVHSTPALLVASLVVCMVWVARHNAGPQTIEKYEQAARHAVEEEDWEAANLCYRKLAYLNEGNDWAQYGLAIVAEKREQPGRAARLMERLAPLDRPGYAPAHFWLAKHLIDRLQNEKPSPTGVARRRQREIVQKHLEHTVGKAPRHIEAHTLLGQIYLQDRQMDQAARHYRIVANHQPIMRLSLARLYATMGKKELAERQARTSVKQFSQVVKEDKTNIDARLHLAAGYIFLEEFTQAEQILSQGAALHNASQMSNPSQKSNASQESNASGHASSDLRFDTALASLYLTWFDRTKPAKLGLRLELLQRALTFAPHNLTILQRFAALAERQGEAAEQVKAILHKALANGVAPATIHLMLGTLATVSQEYDTAVFHLEQAFEANPRMPVVANNFAWALANNDPPELERALTVVNAALEHAPNHPFIRDTRGQIFIKLGRWKHAVTDLEFALRSNMKKDAIHTSLARAYKELGQASLAAEHKKLAVQANAK